MRTLFGQDISRELIFVSSSDDELKIKLHAAISNANYNRKKTTFILFINNRLVDSPGLKKSVLSSYVNYLPKNTYPFAYLSLTMDPRNVDVNVHPTKKEVHFLWEDRIIEFVQKCIDEQLVGANSSRTFYTQSTFPNSSSVNPAPNSDTPSHSSKGKEKKKESSKDQAKPTQKKKKEDNSLSASSPSSIIRSDSRLQTLTSFITPSAPKFSSSSQPDTSQLQDDNTKRPASVLHKFVLKI
eukprot:TRINITY_DN2058_c0_g1_i3.p1 TRINITY_DN2058_c0_g1~~TRINITY_DN2058_c0_g1_i3.p1  ORF type:complete len:240 (-),score=53.20 TRINITY_DN2058_c0_g1_i3:899-1618(-)